MLEMTLNAGVPASQKLPGAGERWRCGGCGNLTRFDVVRTATTHEFWHVDLGGAAQIEDTAIKAESIESVTCRWCGRSDAIELVPRPDSEGG